MKAAPNPAPAQLALGIPLDPVQLAKLTAPERGARYRDLGLCDLQIAAAEAAVRQVIVRRHQRSGR